MKTPDDIFKSTATSEVADGTRMSKTLSVFRFFEYLTGFLLAAVVLTADNNNWGVLGAYLLYVALNGSFILVALWAFVFRARMRRKAASVLLLPIAFLALPLIVRQFIGGPIGSGYLYAALTLLILGSIAWGIAVPGKVKSYLPLGLFGSRLFNCGLLLLLVVGWILPVIGLLYVIASPGDGLTDGQGSPGMGLAYVLLMFAIYFIAVGLVSFVIALWAWLGYRATADRAQRKLHIWQMVAAAPGVLIGAGATLMLAAQGIT